MGKDSSLKKMTKKSILESCIKNKLYRLPHLNDVLYLHFQGYGSIESLEEYTALKCLWLESNAISEIKGLEHQKNLKCLFLQNNLIEKIENLSGCEELDTLNLCHNYIRKIENIGFDVLPVLNTLSISHNCLRTGDQLEQLKNCTSLSVLDLSHNKIEDVVVVKILGEMPQLRVLTMTGNPVISKIPQYRKTLILECKELTYLDSRPVFPRDRACAEAWKRGGFSEEQKEHTRWVKEERRKTRQSVNALLALRRAASGDDSVELLRSSSDEEDADERPPSRMYDDNLNMEENTLSQWKEVETQFRTNGVQSYAEPTSSNTNICQQLQKRYDPLEDEHTEIDKNGNEQIEDDKEGSNSSEESEAKEEQVNSSELDREQKLKNEIHSGELNIKNSSMLTESPKNTKIDNFEDTAKRNDFIEFDEQPSKQKLFKFPLSIEYSEEHKKFPVHDDSVETDDICDSNQKKIPKKHKIMEIPSTDDLTHKFGEDKELVPIQNDNEAHSTVEDIVENVISKATIYVKECSEDKVGSNYEQQITFSSEKQELLLENCTNKDEIEITEPNILNKADEDHEILKISETDLAQDTIHHEHSDDINTLPITDFYKWDDLPMSNRVPVIQKSSKLQTLESEPEPGIDNTVLYKNYKNQIEHSNILALNFNDMSEVTNNTQFPGTSKMKSPLIEEISDAKTALQTTVSEKNANLPSPWKHLCVSDDSTDSSLSDFHLDLKGKNIDIEITKDFGEMNILADDPSGKMNAKNSDTSEEIQVQDNNLCIESLDVIKYEAHEKIETKDNVVHGVIDTCISNTLMMVQSSTLANQEFESEEEEIIECIGHETETNSSKETPIEQDYEIEEHIEEEMKKSVKHKTIKEEVWEIDLVDHKIKCFEEASGSSIISTKEHKKNVTFHLPEDDEPDLDISKQPKEKLFLINKLLQSGTDLTFGMDNTLTVGGVLEVTDVERLQAEHFKERSEQLQALVDRIYARRDEINARFDKIQALWGNFKNPYKGMPKKYSDGIGETSSVDDAETEVDKIRQKINQELGETMSVGTDVKSLLNATVSLVKDTASVSNDLSCNEDTPDARSLSDWKEVYLQQPVQSGLISGDLDLTHEDEEVIKVIVSLVIESCVEFNMMREFQFVKFDENLKNVVQKYRGRLQKFLNNRSNKNSDPDELLREWRDDRGSAYDFKELFMFHDDNVRDKLKELVFFEYSIDLDNDEEKLLHLWRIIITCKQVYLNYKASEDANVNIPFEDDSSSSDSE